LPPVPLSSPATAKLTSDILDRFSVLVYAVVIGGSIALVLLVISTVYKQDYAQNRRNRNRIVLIGAVGDHGGQPPQPPQRGGGVRGQYGEKVEEIDPRTIRREELRDVASQETLR
jgi:hypothetical protein